MSSPEPVQPGTPDDSNAGSRPASIQSRPLDSIAIILMIVFSASWSLQQVAAKLAMTEVPALMQASIRSIVATILVGIWCRYTDKNVFARDKTLLPGLLAGLLFSLEFLFLFLGLQWTNASHAVLFLYTSPFFVALGVNLFVPDERLRKMQWAGLALSFLGVTMVLQLSGQMSWAVLLGDLFILLAAAIWGATTVTVRITRLRINPAKAMLYQLAFSSVFLPIAAVMNGERWPENISFIPAASLAYQSFWVAGVTFVGFTWLISRYRAAEISAFGFLTPVLGVLAGWAIMNDPISMHFLFAVALVAAGIVLVNRRA